MQTARCGAIVEVVSLEDRSLQHLGGKDKTRPDLKLIWMEPYKPEYLVGWVREKVEIGECRSWEPDRDYLTILRLTGETRKRR